VVREIEDFFRSGRFGVKFMSVSILARFASHKNFRFLMWAVGATCLCVGLGIGFYAVPLALSLHADRTAKINALVEKIAVAPDLPAGVVQGPLRERLSEFRRLPAVLTDLGAVASRSGVAVLDVTSRPNGTKEQSTVGQVQINARTKGSYKSLKSMVSQLLATHEGLAFDALTLRRARATDPLLDSELRFTFYYKSK
jgi:hypothetical protein